MRLLTFDTEATTFQKGNPYSERNKLCLTGLKWNDSDYIPLFIEYDNKPYGKNLATWQGALDDAEIIVGFSLKYEFGWSRRYGIRLPTSSYYWDCQLAEYIISRQRQKLSSLNSACDRAGLGQKISKVEEYWRNGVDTVGIPKDVLLEYNKQDVVLTEQLFWKQWDTPFRDLILASSYDELITSEAEYNGLFWNQDRAAEESKRLEIQIQELGEKLSGYFPGIPINWSSPSQLSVVLFGGVINEEYRQDYEFIYKNGKRAIKQRKAIKEHQFQAIFEPDPKTKNDTGWSTEETVLQRLLKGKGSRFGKKIIMLVLERKGLEKQKGTYFDGFNNIISKYTWEHSLIHTNFNHSLTDTGRLSSGKPNIQNMEDGARECVITRY